MGYFLTCNFFSFDIPCWGNIELANQYFVHRAIVYNILPHNMKFKSSKEMVLTDRLQFLAISEKKSEKIQASMGFEPMPSRD